MCLTYVNGVKELAIDQPSPSGATCIAQLEVQRDYRQKTFIPVYQSP